MRYLLDTGILLRLVNRQSAMHSQIREPIRLLKAQGHETVSSFQNRSEFWNVCTRPATARGGLGLTLDETQRRLRVVERITELLPDGPEVYFRWRELVAQYHVQGVQVHDTKLVALMSVQGVTHLLTLSSRDFIRFPEVVAVSPEHILS